MILRCTAKVLQLLGIRPAYLAAPAASPDDDWYANLLWFDGRKCLLLTHSGTLFSGLAADVRKADVLPIGPFAVGLIERDLRSEGPSVDTFGRLGPDSVHLARTANRSVLGCMVDMAFQLEHHIAASAAPRDLTRPMGDSLPLAVLCSRS
jgi:hypothetical protein